MIGFLRQLLGQITFTIAVHLGPILVFAKLFHDEIVIQSIVYQW